MVLRILLFGLFLGTVFSMMAQTEKPAKYWVQLSDKNNTPYRLDQPEEFLSARALQRRFHQNIELDSTDLPVNPDYLAAIQQQGIRIHGVSKWLNSVAIISDSSSAYQLLKLPFVTRIRYVGKHLARNTPAPKNPPKNKAGNTPPERFPMQHGLAESQVRLIGGDILHDLGHRGEQMLVAVLDGGFNHVDHLPYYDSLRQSGRLLPGRDLVDLDDYVYETSGHGQQVLSTMAANVPGWLVGSGPGAAYVCIKTEDTKGEYLIEECNWAVGAELADSLGADLINSSLGYTTFNDAAMNYAFDSLDGQRSIASRAADLAFEKGILVVNSAGNSGNDPWYFIGVPADSKHTLAIGATTHDGTQAPFSSFGPSADGRVKPDIATVGYRVVVPSGKGFELRLANGTSFASPLMCGSIASLWSAFPQRTNREIKQAVLESGDRFDRPDAAYGYGIPDMLHAFQTLAGQEEQPRHRRDLLLTTPETFAEAIDLTIFSFEEKTARLRVKDAVGKVWYTALVNLQPGRNTFHRINEAGSWPGGHYQIEVYQGEDLSVGSSWHRARVLRP